MKRFLKIVLPGLIIGIFVVVSLLSAFQESLTYDEVVNIQEGKNAFLHQTYDIELYHPPLAKVLQTAPIVLLEDGLHIRLSPIYEKNIARSIVILMGVSLVVSVFLITNYYFGYLQALMALFFIAFEPNTVAFSHIINTDALVNVMIFICYTLLISLLLKPTKVKAVAFAICVGMGLSSKMSFDSFFTLSALALVLYVKKWQTLSFLWSRKYYLVFLIFVSLLVIWSTYFFKWNVIVKERNDGNRFSARLLKYATTHHNRSLISAITVLEHQKFPLGDYIALYKNVALAKASPTCFFLGSYYPKCYWYFMPTTFFLKTPLPFLLFSFIGLSLIFTIKKKKQKYVYFSLPFIVIFVHAALSGAFPLNRYMLPVYPFGAIMGSYCVLLLKNKWRIAIAVIVCLWYVSNFIFSYPHYLSFTNEISGPKNIQYHRFWDANYDWGQSMPDVLIYAKKQKINTLYLSYFGRDNGELYGLRSDKPYGSYKLPEICEFHTIHFSTGNKQITLMSLSNWYQCGYYKMNIYKKPKGLVSDSFLLF